MLLFFLWTQPDGKLHLVFCDVGQGDAAYIRFPDGRDMLIDGGPNDRVLRCLGKYMPFWDREINLVALTHPQRDHMQGLISVLARYKVDFFLKSDVDNSTKGYADLTGLLKQKNIPVKLITRGEQISIGPVELDFLWPSREQISKAKTGLASQGQALRSYVQSVDLGGDVLGYSAPPGDVNDYSLVFRLRYESFDAVFTGDADSHVEDNYIGDDLVVMTDLGLTDATIEVLKVPHHGSKTGMTQAFVNWSKPQLAVISVGKNTYGHPTAAALELLQSVKSAVARTDELGDIEIVSDGSGWLMR